MDLALLGYWLVSMSLKVFSNLKDSMVWSVRNKVRLRIQCLLIF